jgi:hypothetical protein
MTSSKGHAGTWSQTGSTSPAQDGDWRAQRRSSSYGHCGQMGISPATGPIIWPRKDAASTSHATPWASSHAPREVTPGDPHPNLTTH